VSIQSQLPLVIIPGTGQTNLFISYFLIYNNSSKELSPKQHRVLELGLNFAITPKKFPLLEYIAATENLCQALEQYGDDESVVKAQTIRNIAINHIRKRIGMKIKDNLLGDDAKILE